MGHIAAKQRSFCNLESFSLFALPKNCIQYVLRGHRQMYHISYVRQTRRISFERHLSFSVTKSTRAGLGCIRDARVATAELFDLPSNLSKMMSARIDSAIVIKKGLTLTLFIYRAVNMEESASTEIVGTSITTSSTVSPQTSDPTADDLDVSHYAIVFSQVLVWVF